MPSLPDKVLILLLIVNRLAASVVVVAVGVCGFINPVSEHRVPELRGASRQRGLFGRSLGLSFMYGSEHAWRFAVRYNAAHSPPEIQQTNRSRHAATSVLIEWRVLLDRPRLGADAPARDRASGHLLGQLAALPQIAQYGAASEEQRETRFQA
jgi:hypothetical protein